MSAVAEDRGTERVVDEQAPAVLPVPDPEPAKVAHKRAYIVLKESTFNRPAGMQPATVKAFEIVGVYSAGGDRQAVRLAVEEHGVGRYVAVSESSWHEHRPDREKVERLVWR